jgi:hypothetical protein
MRQLSQSLEEIPTSVAPVIIEDPHSKESLTETIKEPKRHVCIICEDNHQDDHNHAEGNAHIPGTLTGDTLDVVTLDLPSRFIENIGLLPIDASVNFQLPGNITANGILKRADKDKNGYPIYVEGVLIKPAAGRFSFRKEIEKGNAWPMSGVITVKDSANAYRIEPHPDQYGVAQIVTYPIEKVMCVEFPALELTHETAEADSTQAILPADYPTDIPIPSYQNGVIPLESRPGLTAVLYLDFDGEDGPHENWGNFYAEPISDLSVQNIFRVWRRVAEDFAPFELNVTTDLQVYLDAPENSRQRCIITPTTDAEPSAGGVAYLGSFDWSGDTPCWSFYGSGKSAAEVISHEFGHTLDLRHDGRTNPSQGYYSGHGSGEVSWAPIMGVSYSKTLSQWSKGEYLNANNTEDDIAIIANNNNNVSMRVDLDGDTPGTATYLEIAPDTSVDAYGYITTENDYDVFSFNTSGGALSLTIKAEDYGPNIDILAQLYDSQNNLIVTNNPDTLLDASINSNLGAGNYTLHISGTGRGDPLAYGYPAYGSIGSYKISGSISGGTYTEQFTINENPLINTLIGILPTLNDHGTDTLIFTILSGNSNNAFSLNSQTGQLRVADPLQFNYETLATTLNEPAEIAITYSVTNENQPNLNETRTLTITINDVNEAPAPPDLTTLIPEGLRAGFEVARCFAHDPDNYSTHTWSIFSGNNDATFQIDNEGVITVANPPEYFVNPSFELVVQATDSGSPALSGYANVTINILNVISNNFEPGMVYRTFYEDISGNSVRTLTSASKFPNSPDYEKALDELSDDSYGENYGSTVRAYLIPPYDGTYTFWIASDNTSELWLSSSGTPALMIKRAFVNGYTQPKEWDKYSTQQSIELSLMAGRIYYLEIRHKESTSGDHLAVAWQAEVNGVTVIDREIIPIKFLAPHHLNYTPIFTGPSSINLRENAFPGSKLANLTATDINSDQNLSFSITSGNENGDFVINSLSGQLSLVNAQALDATNNPIINLGIAITDDGYPIRTLNENLTINILDASAITTNQLVQEFWTSISGAELNELYDHPNWPDLPDEIQLLDEFNASRNYGDNYGTRIQAYLTPPSSGEYIFYLSSDNEGTLRLSSDATKANASQIASVPGFTSYEEWNKYPEQSSSPINLIAGQPYFIEARFKEADGGDHLNLAWTGPDNASLALIPADYFEPYNNNSAPVFENESYRYELANYPLSNQTIGTINASSQSFEDIRYAILDGNNQNNFVIDHHTGVITFVDNEALNPGQVYELTIGAQDDGYGGFFPYGITSTPVAIRLNGTPIQNWRGDNFGNAFTDSQITGNLQDPDGDNLSNLLEYALNLDPMNATSMTDLPQLDDDSDNLRFVYRENILASDLDYRIQDSIDLNNLELWNDTTILNEETLSEDGETRLIRATLAKPNDGSNSANKAFFRLKIEASSP